MADHITAGKFITGDADDPKIVVGYAVQQAIYINVNDAFPASEITVFLPKKTSSASAEDAMSEGNVQAAGVFSIQQEIDNQYAHHGYCFCKTQMGFAADEYSATEIKLKPGTDEGEAKKTLQKIFGDAYTIQTRYEQNSNLYSTMRMEKWAIYAVLTLILIIAAFNMVSALTMLVLEKRKDISILRSMGTTVAAFKKYFYRKVCCWGLSGAAAGIVLALLFCFLQMRFHLIKIQGGSFLIDYFR